MTLGIICKRYHMIYFILHFLFQFSSLMDEHVGAKFDSIGLNAMANKDNSRKLSFAIHCMFNSKGSTLVETLGKVRRVQHFQA